MATETRIDVVMPQMGVSVSEGTITKWLKQQGEAMVQILEQAGQPSSGESGQMLDAYA